VDVVRQEGKLLVVSHGARLGGACVKCASTDVVGTRFELLQQPLRWWGHFAFVFGVPGILFEAFRRRTAGVFLPVCRLCEVRWRRAVRVRSWVALSFIPASFVAMVALAAEARGSLPDGAGSGIGLALALAWSATYLVTRFGKGSRWRVTAASIDRELLSLRGVHPEALAVIVADASALRRSATSVPRVEGSAPRGPGFVSG
jgi:hypothetical protein